MVGSDSDGEGDRMSNKAGELFAECRRKYGLEPEEVLGLLGYTGEAKLFEVREGDDYQGHFNRIGQLLHLASSRVLRPAGSIGALEVELDRAEHLALEAAAAMRFPDFGHWAGVWASINSAIGKPYRTSPFSGIASLARDRLEG